MDEKCFGIAFAPNPLTLATVSGVVEDYFNDAAPEYVLRLWNVATGKEQAVWRTISRKTNALYHCPGNITFSPDGQHIAVSHLRHAELWKVGLVPE